MNWETFCVESRNFPFQGKLSKFKENICVAQAKTCLGKQQINGRDSYNNLVKKQSPWGDGAQKVALREASVHTFFAEQNSYFDSPGKKCNW